MCSLSLNPSFIYSQRRNKLKKLYYKIFFFLLFICIFFICVHVSQNLYVEDLTLIMMVL